MSQTLLRMPFFFPHPPGGHGIKDEHRGVLGRPGEDSVSLIATTAVFGRQALGGFVQHRDRAYRVNGKSPARHLVVAPSVKVPVPAVVDNALGGYCPVALRGSEEHTSALQSRPY